MSTPSVCPACGSAAAEPSHLGEVRFDAFKYRYLACGGCGSLYADPMPGPEVLAQIYAPAYAADHYAAELDGQSSNHELVRETEAVLTLLSARKPAARLLDIGCGAGRFMVFAAASGFRVEGHELMAASAAVAERTTGLPVHAGTLTSLPGATMRFTCPTFSSTARSQSNCCVRRCRCSCRRDSPCCAAR